MHLDHLVTIHVRHVMSSVSVMVDDLVARKTLVIMFTLLQEKWQQLGHIKLNQGCAASVHLM